MFFVSFERGTGPWKHRIDPQAVIDRLCPYAKPDKNGFMEKDRALLVQALHWNTPSSILEPAPFYHVPTETAVVSWARIDNGAELAEALGLSRTSLNEFSDSEIILQTYLKWGEDCVLHLIGDFSFVIYDAKKEKLFCARDHMGVRPFYYFLSPERFVCATSLAALVCPDIVPTEADEEWICEYLCFLSMSWDRTVYKGIRKLPPANSLTVKANSSQLRQYFHLADFKELKLKDPREYVDVYRAQLEESIKCRLVTNYSLGSELSGGLDSSTVTAYAARFFNQPLSSLHAFAQIALEQELRYVEEVSRASQLLHLHILTNGGLYYADIYRRSSTALGYPAELDIGIWHDKFYRVAEGLNIRTMLSGFGGDEFVTTIFAYIVPAELLAKRCYKDLYRILPGNALSRLLRLIKRQLKEIAQHIGPQSKYNPDMYEACHERLPLLLARQELVEHYDLTERYLDQARFDAGYTDFKRFTLEYCWQPHIPTRLELCTLMGATRGIECRWPLLDVRLVKMFMSIPSEEYYYRGLGRYMHRRAAAGTVPDLVVWKPSKYMGNFIDKHRAVNRPDDLSITSLDSALAQWIDLRKLHQQLLETSQPVDQSEKSWQVGHNLRKVKHLDLWMKERVVQTC